MQMQILLYKPLEQRLRFSLIVTSLNTAMIVLFRGMGDLMRSQFSRTSSAKQTVLFRTLIDFHRNMLSMTMHMLI